MEDEERKEKPLTVTPEEKKEENDKDKLFRRLDEIDKKIADFGSLFSKMAEEEPAKEEVKHRAKKTKDFLDEMFSGGD